MEAVSALMDKKITELKVFVWQMVKKLPQPVKLEVVGGVRKALVLHFACARTGKTVTTETRFTKIPFLNFLNFHAGRLKMS